MGTAPTIQDLKLSGTGLWMSGPDSLSGNVTLEVKGKAESRVEIDAVPRLEVVDASNVPPKGQWTGTDGTPHPMALHNCFLPTAWFAPHVALQLAIDASGALSYVGQEQHNGVNADHVRVLRPIPMKSPGPTALNADFANFDLYLDATSHLPLFLAFNLREDKDSARNVLVEVRFGNYQQVQGVNVPMRFQRLVSGNLNLDVTVTSAVINSGLSDSDFSLQ